MILLEIVLPVNVLYVVFCTLRLIVFVVEINRVDALIVEPVSVENWLRFKLGTMIVDATKVHTVSVELMFALLPINVDTINVLFMNDVFKVIVDTVSVELIIAVLLNRVDTASVELIIALLVFIVDKTSVDANIDEPVMVEN